MKIPGNSAHLPVEESLVTIENNPCSLRMSTLHKNPNDRESNEMPVHSAARCPSVTSEASNQLSVELCVGQVVARAVSTHESQGCSVCAIHGAIGIGDDACAPEKSNDVVSDDGGSSSSGWSVTRKLLVDISDGLDGECNLECVGVEEILRYVIRGSVHLPGS